MNLFFTRALHLERDVRFVVKGQLELNHVFHGVPLSLFDTALTLP